MPTNITFESVVDYIKLFFAQYAIKVIGAIIIFAVGIYVAKWVGRMLSQSFERKQMEPPLRTLIVRVVKLVILVFTVIIAAEKLGLPIMSLVAGVGVAGVGVGLAMQGVLGNLVAGLTIIFTKPFRVGEYIDIHGIHGLVSQIELFSTVLTHTDRSRVLIPNRKIVGEIVHNYGTIRQLDLNVGVSYDTNIADALALTRDILQRNPRVLKEFPPCVGVTTLADSSINIAVKPWVAVADYTATHAELYQTILEEFRARNIQIPFPQREVRIVNSAEQARAQSVAA
jgi:small conductance mechanosensitive channel